MMILFYDVLITRILSYYPLIHYDITIIPSPLLPVLPSLPPFLLQMMKDPEQSFLDFQETVDILQAKVRKLEQLVKLKDKRIEGDLASVR